MDTLTDKSKANSLAYSIMQVRLSNQRTYLSYTTVGLGTATFAFTFKKYWIFFLGILIMLMSTIQYYLIEYRLDNGVSVDTNFIHYFPSIITGTVIIIFMIESLTLRKVLKSI